MQSSDVVEILPKFTKESSNQLCQTMPQPKRGGPYTKDSKQKRREEVYRLHFDYGYSARKISDIMKINRNTINSDITQVYCNLETNSRYFDNETLIHGMLHRLELQRIRIREKIDKIDDPKEYIILEKLLLDIDYKIISINQKMAESTRRIWDLTTNAINSFFKEEKRDTRYLTLFDKIAVSEKAQKKIQEIIMQDKKKITTL